jgi:acetylornithine deacetylase
MKGFIALVGCLGAPHLIDALPALELRPRLAIIGEPTGMRPVNAHKGCSVFSTTVIGLDGHASAPQRGVSAISAAVEIIAVLDRIAARQRAAADPATRFDPPYTTLNVGRIEGGTAFNVIARECRFTWEIRPLPGIDPACVLREIDDFVAQDLLPRMRRVHPASSVVTTPIVTVPPLAPDPHGAAETLVRDLAGDGEPGTVAFTTEAGLFQRAGLSAMICGPGSIADAHRPDEFVSLAQLEAGGVFLDRLTARVVGG